MCNKINFFFVRLNVLFERNTFSLTFLYISWIEDEFNRKTVVVATEERKNLMFPFLS